MTKKDKKNQESKDQKDLNDQRELKNIIEFPCSFSIKVFGAHGSTCVADTEKIVAQHFPDLAKDRIKIKDSKGGKYCAINIEIDVDSQQQLDAIYTDLSKCPSIIMVL